MYATKHYFRPFWQGFFLTAAFCVLSFDAAQAVTEQPVDYSPAELEELVGPVALYPDDLIAIILPASTYPLQIVEAARYLEEHEKNPALTPDEDWDDAVVALLNYPEVIALMNEDLDWTWNLGEAVVNQQADVLDAVQDFRGRAVAAGNFESDDRQTVTVVDEIIEVTPVDPEVIYVPYYEPSRVVVYQRRPVYHYYPHAYPVYYYPYPVHYSFASGFFWGVTTAYTIGWLTDRVHYHYYGYASHPYYGHYYPSYYYTGYATRARHHHRARSHRPVVYDKKHYGNSWKPRHRHGDRPRYRRTDRRQDVASNFTGSAPRRGSADDTRVRSGGDRDRRTGVRSRQDRESAPARETRSGTTVTRSRERRGKAADTGRNTRVATLDQSDSKITSRRNRAARTRSGSNQIVDTRSKGHTETRADARTPRRAGEQANTSRRTARETRDGNSTRVNRTVTRVNRSTATPRRAGNTANTSRRTARETRDGNSTRVNRTVTRVNRSTATPRRTESRAQPRQQRRQASRATQSNKRSASTPRAANTSKARQGNRSATRVASAGRSSAGRSQSRSTRGGSARRGNRR
jgi:hypothetical protein